MENELYHYGVKGMKWGVRRTPAQLGRSTGSNHPTENLHDDYKRAHGTKSVKSMSDSELRQRINRLQMEKQYNQLTQQECSSGKQFVKQVLRESAKQTASKYVSKYMSKGIDLIIKQASQRRKYS